MDKITNEPTGTQFSGAYWNDAETPDTDIDWLTLASEEMRAPIKTLRALIGDMRKYVIAADPATKAQLLPRLASIVKQVTFLEKVVTSWDTSANISVAHISEPMRPIQLSAVLSELCELFWPKYQIPWRIYTDSDIWLTIDTTLLGHMLQLIFHSIAHAANPGLVEIVCKDITGHAGRIISIAMADRRAEAPKGQKPDPWHTVEMELADGLIRELGGNFTQEYRAKGGRITTLWLPARFALKAA